MSVRNQLPGHLLVNARTAHLTSEPMDNAPYDPIAMEMDISTNKTNLVDLGGTPLPNQDPKIVDMLIEKKLEVEPEDWYLTLKISKNSIRDDQTGTLERDFRNLLPSFQRDMNRRAFEVLNGGDGATYGLCYDGQNFFSGSHVDKGAKYTTAQDNQDTLAFTPDNLETVLVKAKLTVDDVGVYTNFDYNLLVGPPHMDREFSQVANNEWIWNSGNREINPWRNKLGYITHPKMDSTSWIIVASTEDHKPIIIVIRQRPELNDMWFDAQGGDGGMHYIQYHARYVIAYGDWRLAYQGQT